MVGRNSDPEERLNTPEEKNNQQKYFWRNYLVSIGNAAFFVLFFLEFLKHSSSENLHISSADFSRGFLLLPTLKYLSLSMMLMGKNTWC